MARWLKASPMLMAHPATGVVGNAGLGAWLRLAMWLVIYPQEGNVVPTSLVRSVATRRETKLLLEAGMLLIQPDGYAVTNSLNICGSGRTDDAWRPGMDYPAARPAIARRLRDEVYGRDGHACVFCGATEDLSLDHIYPYSLGGPDTLENLQTLCRRCNSSKGARVP